MMKLVVLVPYCSVECVINDTIAVAEGYLDAENLRFAVELLIKDNVLKANLDLI